MVKGQRHMNCWVFFGVHDAAATRGQYLAFSLIILLAFCAATTTGEPMQCAVTIDELAAVLKTVGTAQDSWSDYRD